MGLILDLLFLVVEIAVSVAKQRRDNRLAREGREEAVDNGSYLRQHKARRSGKV